MRMLWIILGAIAIGLLIPVFYLYFNQRNIVFIRQSLDPNAEQVIANKEFEIEFENEGITLRGWLVRPEKQNLLIYYGGNAEELSYNIEGFENLADYAVLLINFRGYGKSEGSPTEKDIVTDSLHIFDEIKTRYSSIVIIGRSLGCGVAVQVAAARPVDGLVLVTPYDSVAAIGKMWYPWAPVSLLVKDKFDSLSIAGAVKARTLFLVAEEDNVIPRPRSEALAAAWVAENEWEVINLSDHNSITEFPEYWNRIRAFLIKE